MQISRRLQRASQFLLLTAMITTLCACGFQLRGTGSSATVLPPDWTSLHLVTANPNSEFSRELISRFELNGVSWTDRESANYQLFLGPEQFDQRNLSLNSEARAAEFELTMRSRFSVRTAKGEIALEETTASVVKQMENNPRNVVGKAEEVRLLQREMRTELAQRILRRIGFYASSLNTDTSETN